MTWVLGIGGYSHDASAALVHDGELLAAAQEERLTRIKHVGGFPYKAIDYCLAQGGIGRKDVSTIAFYARKSNWDGYLAGALKASVRHLGTTLSHRKGFVTSIGYRVYRSLSFRADLARFFYDTGFDPRLFRGYDHHACHAASAFYSSPFDYFIGRLWQAVDFVSKLPASITLVLPFQLVVALLNPLMVVLWSSAYRHILFLPNPFT